MQTKTFSPTFLARAAMTLLLALFVTASAWAQYVFIEPSPQNAGDVFCGKDPNVMTTYFVDDAQANDVIYFRFTPAQNYRFSHFNFFDGNISEADISESDGLYSFVMPDLGSGLTILQFHVVFEYIPPVVEGVDINAENFPDENFRNWLLSQTYGADAVITDQEMAGITKIVARGLQIQDLTGIEYFTQLTELDVSNNPETMPEYQWNVIESIDLSSNTNLRKLYCDYNQLQYLILFANTELRELSCSNNQLGSIDLSPSENLQKLTCSNNQIGFLDLTGFPNLSGLWCDGNELNVLDISGNPILELFQCENNQLENISGVQDHSILRLFNCNDNMLTTLDVTRCPELYQLYCWNNQIKGDDMTVLMNSLPERSGYCVVLDLREGAPEQNEITNEQIAIGKAKGWSVEGKTGDGENDVVPLGNTNEHEYVDLGLPSGTLWATTNVGATRPHDIGLFFAWGETEGHGADPNDGYMFDWNNYKWSEVVGNQSYLTKYCTNSDEGLDGFYDYKYVLDCEDDAAYVNWGDDWRTPSMAQFKELQEYCTWTWTEVQGVNGFEVTGRNGNSIFLPQTGWRIDDMLLEDGAYWARTSDPDNQGAYQLAWYYQSEELCWQEVGGRCNGQCVRPVVNKSIKTKYYLLGDFNNWNEQDMIPFDDNDCTSLTMTLSGEFLVKDTIGNWWGGETNEEKYTLNSANASVELSSSQNKKNLNFEFSSTYMLSIQDGELSVFGFPTGYYITGTFNEWAHELMTDNGDGTYTIQKELAPDDEFKFRDPNGNWYGGDTDNHGDKYKVNSSWCTDIPLTMGGAGSNFKIEAGGDNLYTIIVTKDGENLKLDVQGFGFIALTDNSDNSEAIEYGVSTGNTTDVKLLGRTLYKDGGWNTLCLPFMVDLTDESCPLAGDGVEARELEDANFVNGTLTLTFSNPVEMLSAGVPYIIKWDNAEEDIIEPTFYGTSQWSSMLQPVEFEGVITFTGTYSPVNISSLGDDTKLFIGAANSVFYPNAAMTIGCQRAYFQLADGISAGNPDNSSTPIKAFELNFGEENGISLINTTTPEGCWFSIDGLRHSTMPTQRGIYIQNGRKFFVK